MSATNETEESVESKQFDAEFLHNYGDLDPIPIGARALCGAVSTKAGYGTITPPASECCPICLALTNQEEPDL